MRHSGFKASCTMRQKILDLFVPCAMTSHSSIDQASPFHQLLLICQGPHARSIRYEIERKRNSTGRSLRENIEMVSSGRNLRTAVRWMIGFLLLGFVSATLKPAIIEAVRLMCVFSSGVPTRSSPTKAAMRARLRLVGQLPATAAKIVLAVLCAGPPFPQLGVMSVTESEGGCACKSRCISLSSSLRLSVGSAG